MNQEPYIKKIAGFNIFLILFICVDCFVVKPSKEVRLFEDYGTVTSKPRRGNPYQTNLLLTTAGERLQIPLGLDIPLAKGDTLFLERTGFLNRNLNIYFSSGDYDYTIPIGLFNDGSLLYKFLFPICFILSVIAFLPVRILKLGDNYLIFLMISSLTVWVVFFIFYMFFY